MSAPPDLPASSDLFEPPGPPASAPRVSSLRSAKRVRELTAEDLGLQSGISGPTSAVASPPEAEVAQLPSEIVEGDEILTAVRDLLADGFLGIIFFGPPGTGKTWYAAQVAALLADRDPRRVRMLQFHASYQYEDFVEGFVPQEKGGFQLEDKHLLEMCEVAREEYPKLCFIVIDEFSRANPGRVFGEALTYLERSKRNRPFRLASGKVATIPDNLVLLVTMNPMDRSVDEVDAAVERRFARIAMDPSPVALRVILKRNGMSDLLIARIEGFYRWLLKLTNRECHIGHAYFAGAKDEAGINRLWNHQLRFFFERVFRFSKPELDDVEREWKKLVFPAGATPAAAPPGSSTAADPPPGEPSRA